MFVSSPANCERLHPITPEEATISECINDTLEINYDSFAFLESNGGIASRPCLAVKHCQQRRTSTGRKTKAAAKEQQTALDGLIRGVAALPAGT